MGDALRIGLVGAGVISAAYAGTFPRLPGVTLTRVADLDLARAGALAARFPGVVAGPPDALYAADDVDLVLNLTLPQAHASVALAAIAAGKHVYNEKPLAATTAAAAEVLAAAAAAGLAVGCAPDTFLGTGVQTARASLDAGDIGTPVAAVAFMTCAGHESWHPAPEFYYQPGGGPLMDMGPYYLTALIALLGPVRRVVGMSATPRAERTIANGPRTGTTFPVSVATHVTGVLEHTGGALSTLMMSFDIRAAVLPRIEVYGSAGSLALPDPNHFDGTVRISSGGDWSDLAEALATGTPYRASGELAYHVLEVMEGLLAGGTAEITSTCPRPAAVP